MIAAIKKILGKKREEITEKPAEEAYDLWSDSYDHQPGNLMLDLDKVIFSELFAAVDCRDKRVADIGCGTGRHWKKIYAAQPESVVGFDVSSGMLAQLIHKFPHALTIKITGGRLEPVPDHFADCVISTLTIAHIKEVDEALSAWSRILKEGGDLIVTDFHPATLASGGRRSFRHEGKSFSVVNYVHKVEEITKKLREHGLSLVRQKEICIAEEHRHYYAAQHALPVYDRYKGMPVIYGLHLKKEHAAG